MPTPVALSPHDDAVLAALETVAATGFAEAPDGAVDAIRAGGDDYIVLYPISGQRTSSDLVDYAADAELVYQTTVVAKLPGGARWLIDGIEAALYTVEVDGRAVIRVEVGDVGDVRRDDDVQPPVFYATPRWRLFTTPA